VPPYLTAADGRICCGGSKSTTLDVVDTAVPTTGPRDRGNPRARTVTTAGRLPKRRGRTVAGVPSLCDRPRLSICPRTPPQKACPFCTRRATSRMTQRLRAPRRKLWRNIPLGGFLTKEGTAIPSPTDQGFEGWPAKGSTAAPDQPSQGQHGHAHTKPSLERKFEMSYVVFKASQRRLVRGIPARESVDPSDPIEWV